MGREQPPEGKLLVANDGESHAAQEALNDGNKDDAHKDASEGVPDGFDKTVQDQGMQMEDAGRDKMDALRVEGEDDSEEKEEEEVPENGHGATKDVEAPVDNGGHGVCGKIAEVLGYLIENGLPFFEDPVHERHAVYVGETFVKELCPLLGQLKIVGP